MIYRILILPTILLGIFGFAVHYLYVFVLCENMVGSIPFTYKYCPGREINTLPYLPLENLTQHTVSISETLSNGDASAPHHCIEAKMSLVEIRAEIMHSDMQPEIKDSLV